MAITTEYRGYKITYSENGNVWNCYDAKAEADSLAKLKAKIDRMHLQMRKAAARPCLDLDGANGDPGRVREATAIDVRPKSETVYNPRSPLHNQKETFYQVAVTAESRGYGTSGGIGRSWARITDLAPDTEETHTALRLVRQRYEESLAASERLKAAWKAVPRLTEDDIADLIEAASARLTEGSDDLVD